MSIAGHVTLLIGSPRGGRSTSAQLGGFLVARLQERGWTADTVNARAASASAAAWTELARAVAASDLVIVAMPLYVDSLPAPLIETFERLYASRRNSPSLKPQRLVAIMNCGFPEARQNETALAICRCFARCAGFRWDGGLALGMGGMLSGQPIAEHGRTHAVAVALRRTAEDLAGGGAIPEAAAQALAKPMMPVWLYRMMAELSFRITAWRRGVRHLGARPYAREDN